MTTKREWKVAGPFDMRNYGEPIQFYFIQGEIGGKTERTIAEVGNWRDREHTLEDAYLLAAAPELYEALRSILAEYQGTDDIEYGSAYYNQWQQAIQALSKVKGD